MENYRENVSKEIVMSLEDGDMRCDFYNNGEGLSSNFDLVVSSDIPLLTFRVRKKEGNDWVEMENGSARTLLPANTPKPTLKKALRFILKAYMLLSAGNVALSRKTMVKMSWLSQESSVLKEEEED